MKNSTLTQKETKYMNPYLAGLLLGLIIIFTVFVTGRGLGASGALKSVVVTGVETIAPNYAKESLYYQEYSKGHEGSPLKSWLVFEIIGVIIGAFISGLVHDRFKLKIDHGPSIQSKTRLLFALIGGAFFGFGASLGRGCTSGAALSGMSVLSTAGFITTLAIFGGAYIFAYFFRKLWI